MKRLLPILFCLCCLSGFAANPAFTDFAAPQFNTAGNKVGILPDISTNSAIRVIGGSTTNFSAQQNYGFSMGLQRVPFIQKALLNAQSHKTTILWFGDSTGADSIPTFQTLFNNNFLYASEPVVWGAGPSGYWDVLAGMGILAGQGGAATGDPHWWFNQFSITNATTAGNGFAFGIRDSVPVFANRLDMWYMASNTYGSFVVDVSTLAASNTWTRVMTVNETTGNAGIRRTNVSLTPDFYFLKTSNSVAGTESRVVYIWPELQNTASNSVIFYDAHAGGLVPQQWLNMGEVSIAALLTNINPDMIIWQQVKPRTNFDQFTNIFPLLASYASNADWVLAESQTPTDLTSEDDPNIGGFFQLEEQRKIAMTNQAAFVDLYTIWPTNLILRAGLTNAGAGGVHFGNPGQAVSGMQMARQLGIIDYLGSSGTLRNPTNATLGANYFTGNQIVNGALISTGATAEVRFYYQQAGNTHYADWIFAGAGAGTISLTKDGGGVINYKLPFGSPFSMNYDDSIFAGGSPMLGDLNPWQFFGTNSAFRGSNFVATINAPTNVAVLNYSNSWLTATNSRKTNIARRGTWEADFFFVDAVGASPRVLVTVEDAAGGVTNVWKCSIPGGLTDTLTNHYCFRVAPNAIVNVTNISTSTANADIASSKMVWE